MDLHQAWRPDTSLKLSGWWFAVCCAVAGAASGLACRHPANPKHKSFILPRAKFVAQNELARPGMPPTDKAILETNDEKENNLLYRYNCIACHISIVERLERVTNQRLA